MADSSSIQITLEPDVKKTVEENAKLQKQSVSDYINSQLRANLLDMPVREASESVKRDIAESLSNPDSGIPLNGRKLSEVARDYENQS